MAGRGNPKGVGRPKGAKSKVAADVRALARQYTEAAISTLASIMNTGESEQARTMAADKLLDRGWGKAAQAMEITGAEGGPIKTITRIELVPVNGSGNGSSPAA